MARSVDDINAQIDEQIVTEGATNADVLLLSQNPSQTGVWKNIRYAIAVCIGIFEQLLDQFRADNEAVLTRNAPIGTVSWTIQKAFEFQYDSSNPQVLQLINGIPQYPVVDPSKRILTLCVYRPIADGSVIGSFVSLYVAKGTLPPQKLTTPEADALRGYFGHGGDANNLAVGVGIAGNIYQITSIDPDRVYVAGTVFYDGKFADTIQATVTLAVATYCRDFNNATGTLRISDIIAVIKAVPGVVDFDMTDLGIRSSITAFGSRIKLIDAQTISLYQQDALAGYAIPEDAATHTLADVVTFTRVG